MKKNETIMDLAQRIRECADICGGVGALAQKSAIPRRTLDSYLAGGSEPKWSNLCAIAKAAVVNYDWIMDGAGPMTDSASGYGSDMIAEPSSPYGYAPADDYAFIPGYSIQVSAGVGITTDDESVTRRLAFRKNWLKFRGLNEKDLVVVFAKGDSMEPTISDNNTIMVDTSDAMPQDGRMYVIRVDGHLLVKRTQIVPGQGVQLLSDNKDYPPMMVKMIDGDESIQFIGRVVWVGKDV
jgi:phage repressor protein C with HTH and peptisase S24 domain